MIALAVAALAATVIACTRLDLSALRATALGWVLAAFALNSASMLLRAFAWLGALRGALPRSAVSAPGVVRATMIGVLGSAVLPGRAGEPMRTWLVSRRIAQRNALALVVGTLVSLTVLNLLALLLLSVVALPGALFGHGLGWALAWPLALVAVILAGSRLARHGRFARQLAALRDGLAVFRHPRRGAAICALQFGAWGLQALAAYVLLLALHLHPTAPLATAAAILVAVNVTAAVPVTPSNIGVFQAACIGVLAGAGVGSGPGLAYGLLLQGTELVTALALGLPAAAIELVTAGSVPSRPASAPPPLDDDHDGEREHHGAGVDAHDDVVRPRA